MKHPSYLLLILFSAAISGCATRAQPADTPVATPVRVSRVTRASDPLPIRAVGTLATDQTITLAFKVGGPIGEILVDEGDHVRAGQLLAFLVSDEIDAAVQQAAAARDQARRDAERMAALYADSVVTLERYQNAQTGLTVAEARLRSAAFNQSYAEIRSPASGRIQRRFAEAHEQVGSGRPIVQLGVEGDWVLQSGLPDVDIVAVKLGDPADVEFDAMPGTLFSGSIAELGEVADPGTGTFKIKIEIADPDRRLRAGFVGRAAIHPQGSSNLILVPLDALVRASGREGRVFVMEPDSGSASSRVVHIARIMESRFAVTRGLEAGESVVTDGAAYLSDGDPVSIVQ
jgi:membrane fusion protein, multidrug efflux system